ncbi:MAG: class I SAM-dependent methyltransferase [Ardenticatenaceae bacterium]
MRPMDLAVNETVSFVLAHRSSSRAHILDVGCGTGLIASRLQAYGHHVVAIDESAEAVQQARTLGIDAAVAAWPQFEGGPFDVVLFAQSLHHIHPLPEAVMHAHRLLRPSGLVIVEDFAWTESDPATVEWFYGVARLLETCQALSPKEDHEDHFVTGLVRSSDAFALWQRSHDHDLHPAAAMLSTLKAHFHTVAETTVPYLYRYLCPVLAENEEGYAIAAQVLDSERRLAQVGAITLIGRRFVGKKR